MPRCCKVWAPQLIDENRRQLACRRCMACTATFLSFHAVAGTGSRGRRKHALCSVILCGNLWECLASVLLLVCCAFRSTGQSQQKAAERAVVRVSAYYCLSDDVPTGITAFRCLERASVVRQSDSGQDAKGYRLLLCRKSRRRVFWGFYEAGSRAFRLWRAGSLRREKDHRLRNARKSLKEAHPASESTEFGLPNWDLAVRFDTRQAAASLGLEKGLASDFLIVSARVVTKAMRGARTEQDVTRGKTALDITALCRCRPLM